LVRAALGRTARPSTELFPFIALDNAAHRQRRNLAFAEATLEAFMESIIYLVGLIVVVMAILSFFGLH
jgi:small-conductance mechanosensitive channel